MTFVKGKDIEVESQPDPAVSYVVEMHKDFNAPKQYVGTVDEGLTVQRALVESGATSSFRSMDIEVLRKIAGSYEILRMPVEYRPRSDSVAPEQDYAIHPGDKIIVRSGSGGGMEKMMKSVFGNTL